jgi:DNA-binding FrmR family transcriptional regulator
MAAVSKAVNTAAMTLIAASLQECVQEDSKNNAENLERLKKLFLSLA